MGLPSRADGELPDGQGASTIPSSEPTNSATGQAQLTTPRTSEPDLRAPAPESSHLLEPVAVNGTSGGGQDTTHDSDMSHHYAHGSESTVDSETSHHEHPVAGVSQQAPSSEHLFPVPSGSPLQTPVDRHDILSDLHPDPGLLRQFGQGTGDVVPEQYLQLSPSTPEDPIGGHQDNGDLIPLNAPNGHPHHVRRWLRGIRSHLPRSVQNAIDALRNYEINFGSNRGRMSDSARRT